MYSREQIEDLRQLDMKKYQLESDLSKVNEEIEKKQKECNHITVITKNADENSLMLVQFQCLFCKKNMEKISDLFIDARNYGKECYDPFDVVQTTALGIIKTNKDITDGELTNKLNGIISASKSEDLGEEYIKSEKEKSKVKK